MSDSEEEDFYLRFHVGQKRIQNQGLDFLEFELLPGGKLRYANHSSYDGLLRRELYVGPGVIQEVKRMVRSCGVTQLDDSKWNEPFFHGGGIQELEVKIGCHHVSFATSNKRPSSHAPWNNAHFS